MHDPFQTHPATGQYYGTPALTNPFYAAQQFSPLNPAALLNPLAAIAGLSPMGGLGQYGMGQHGIGTQMNQPFAGGIQGGINPLQLQLASILAAQQIAAQQGFGASPLGNGLQNPLLAAYQNPLIGAGVFNSPWNPMLAATGLGTQFGWQQQPQAGLQQHFPYGAFGQGISPFGQIGAQLAPQSWVNQGGMFGGGLQQPFGQVYPLLAQLNARQFQP